MTTDRLAELLEEIGLDFWNDEEEDGTGIRTMTFNYSALAARLRAAGVTVAPQPAVCECGERLRDDGRHFDAPQPAPDALRAAAQPQHYHNLGLVTSSCDACVAGIPHTRAALTEPTGGAG